VKLFLKEGKKISSRPKKRNNALRRKARGNSELRSGHSQEERKIKCFCQKRGQGEGGGGGKRVVRKKADREGARRFHTR